MAGGLEPPSQEAEAEAQATSQQGVIFVLENAQLEVAQVGKVINQAHAQDHCCCAVCINICAQNGGVTHTFYRIPYAGVRLAQLRRPPKLSAQAQQGPGPVQAGYLPPGVPLGHAWHRMCTGSMEYLSGMQRKDSWSQ